MTHTERALRIERALRNVERAQKVLHEELRLGYNEIKGPLGIVEGDGGVSAQSGTPKDEDNK